MFSIVRTDAKIKRDVEREILFDPAVVHDSHIAVAVHEGVVTLGGVTKSYLDSHYAEEAAKRVAGVKAVANELQVKLLSERTDPEIAADALRSLQGEIPEILDSVQLTIKSGKVVLEGEVEWKYQKDRAERAVRSVVGVQSLINALLVRPTINPTDVKREIEEALIRSAQVEAAQVIVEAEGGNVTLKGHVRSWSERAEAERSAWSAPGVLSVANEIEVLS